MKIAMTSLPVIDVVKAHAFYTEILGFKSHTYMPDMHLAIVVSSEDPDGTTLLLEPVDEELYKPFQQAIYKKGYPFIILSTNDIWKTYEDLQKKGVKFTKEPTKQEWGTETIFEDTCGNFVQIVQS